MQYDMSISYQLSLSGPLTDEDSDLRQYPETILSTSDGRTNSVNLVDLLSHHQSLVTCCARVRETALFFGLACRAVRCKLCLFCTLISDGKEEKELLQRRAK